MLVVVEKNGHYFVGGLTTKNLIVNKYIYFFNWLGKCTMMLLHNINTVGICHEHNKDMDFSH